MIESALIIGVSLLLGFTILGSYILSRSETKETGKYQMVVIDEKSIVILDTITGQYWKKPIVENSTSKTTSKETDKYA